VPYSILVESVAGLESEAHADGTRANENFQAWFDGDIGRAGPRRGTLNFRSKGYGGWPDRAGSAATQGRIGFEVVAKAGQT
jgi:hypothetical protein